MSGEANKTFIVRYLDALSGSDKTKPLIDQYISEASPDLKRHIREAEMAFPRYEMRREAIIAEEDRVAVRFRLVATHAVTGKPVDVPGMIWCRVQGNKIVGQWMLLDNQTLMQQLTAGKPEAAAA